MYTFINDRSKKFNCFFDEITYLEETIVLLSLLQYHIMLMTAKRENGVEFFSINLGTSSRYILCTYCTKNNLCTRLTFWCSHFTFSCRLSSKKLAKIWSTIFFVYITTVSSMTICLKKWKNKSSKMYFYLLLSPKRVTHYTILPLSLICFFNNFVMGKFSSKRRKLVCCSHHH